MKSKKKQVRILVDSNVMQIDVVRNERGTFRYLNAIRRIYHEAILQAQLKVDDAYYFSHGRFRYFRNIKQIRYYLKRNKKNAPEGYYLKIEIIHL